MNKKILFIYINYSTFVKTDYEILTSQCCVTKYQYKPVKGILKNIYQLLKEIIYLILNLWKYNSVFIWFADFHSFFPVLFAKLLNKKSFIIIGGYDVCRIPYLKYGAFYNKFRGFFTLNSIKYCTLNLPVSIYVNRVIKSIAPKANSKLIYNSVRLINNFEKKVNKDNIILTVGLIPDEKTFLRKGIDTFFEVAVLLPEYKFICIGIDKKIYKKFIKNLPPNIELIEKVPQLDLINYYKKAKIYAQFSRMDTFCLTLAEAMLFECFPIITNEGGMPEVVGDTGIILKRDTKLIAAKINSTIQNYNNIDTNKIRRRIINKFSLNQRKMAILNFLNQAY